MGPSQPPHFQSAEEVITTFKEANIGLNENWLKIAVLYQNERIVAIALLVNDKKSMSLISITTERNNLSFGTYLCIEIINYCCQNNYSSFDAGVSIQYDTYKDKVFIDSKEVFNVQKSFISKFL